MIAIVLGLLVPVIYIAWLVQGAIADRLQARRDAAADDWRWSFYR